MKFFIVLSSLVAMAVAAPSAIFAGETLIASPQFYGAAPLLRQYHAQDSFGQYSYGYEGGPSAKNEVRSLDGVTRGSYSFVDPEGKLQSVAYSADALNGFRVAATNLPEGPKELVAAPLIAPLPVQDTPEVVAARAAHLKIVEQGGVAPLPKAALPDLPEPVKETEEVAEAREKHLQAIEDAKMGKVQLPVAPEFAELKPVEDTVEVKLAKSAHLKAVEDAKSLKIPVENIQLISSLPATRIAAVAQPALVAAPVVTRFAAPTVLATNVAAGPVVTRIAAPELVATNFAGAPVVKTIRTSADYIPGQFYEVKQVADPYAYKWNIQAADFSTRTVVNAGIPTGYEIPAGVLPAGVFLDNGRLIRSVEKN